MRRITLVTGALLVVLAFAAATRVADTREGLIAEVVTLLGGLAGVALLIYALTAGRDVPAAPQSPPPARAPWSIRRRSRRDLLLGAGGVALAAFLVVGLAISGGPLWAGFGLVLLLPMIAGCVYLCVRFLRASS